MAIKRQKQPSQCENSPEGATTRRAAKTPAGRAAGGKKTHLPEIPELHSPSDRRLELETMLRPSGATLTAAGFFRLWLADNALVSGGRPSPDDMRQLCGECGTADFGEAMGILNASFRALECIAPRPAADPPYKGFCPEWLADLVAAACRSCPMTWHEAVNRTPLAALTHLALATCRANRVKTGRPRDYSAADRWLLNQYHHGERAKNQNQA